jgi:hypothetical protein
MKKRKEIYVCTYKSNKKMVHPILTTIYRDVG